MRWFDHGCLVGINDPTDNGRQEACPCIGRIQQGVVKYKADTCCSGRGVLFLIAVKSGYSASSNSGDVVGADASEIASFCEIGDCSVIVLTGNSLATDFVALGGFVVAAICVDLESLTAFESFRLLELLLR